MRTRETFASAVQVMIVDETVVVPSVSGEIK